MAKKQGKVEQKEQEGGQAGGKLPRIVLELAGMVSWVDPQTKQPAGPMTAIAAMGRKAKAILELAESEDSPKFRGIVLIRDFAKRVLDDYEATWNALDALEQGKLIQLPAEVQEPKGSDDVGDTDGNGKDKTSGPSRG